MRHSTASPTSTALWRPRMSAYTMLSLRRHRSTPKEPLTNFRLQPMGASLFKPSITAKPSPVSSTCGSLEAFSDLRPSAELGKCKGERCNPWSQAVGACNAQVCFQGRGCAYLQRAAVIEKVLSGGA